ncbi:nuclear transport factor 2 family protein [Sphingosinicella sp. CPCC 101087]|uniref:nuclear transport factor 2 family protein n=1 Tax=Sphingosinicella sp. CPCC 101087 TaxID=2497754 RepID=UPI00101D2773|nr:nuclear transport factor 2 family protein [Sphingosinicella sp. CPCC 101087]
MSRSPSRRELLAAGGAMLTLGPALAKAQAPQLPGTRPWFDAYLEAFNARDYAGFSAFYAPGLRFFGQAATLEGAAAVVDFYRKVHARIDEKVELLTFVSGGSARIAAELRTTLVAREDWPDFPTGALIRGQRRQSLNFAMYDIEDGRFVRIRSARFRRLDDG